MFLLFFNLSYFIPIFALTSFCERLPQHQKRMILNIPVYLFFMFFLHSSSCRMTFGALQVLTFCTGFALRSKSFINQLKLVEFSVSECIILPLKDFKSV